MPNAPLVPVVDHTYVLPAATTGVTVTLTGTESHVYGEGLTFIPATVYATSFGLMTDTFTMTTLYPETLLTTHVYTDEESLNLNVMLAGLQIDPATNRATLFDRLDYEIVYAAPLTMTIDSLTVNAGADVPVGQGNVPLTATFTAATAWEGLLQWEIRDPSGILIASGYEEVSLPSSTSQLGWQTSAEGWEPGSKQLVVTLRDGTLASPGDVMAGGHALFRVVGPSLLLATDWTFYNPEDTEAWGLLDVRDETGAPVTGISGELTQTLDGAPLALDWHGAGVYTATLDLTGVVTGQHVLSATYAGQVAETRFIVDHQPPTSTLSAPAVVHTPTITVTLTGGDDLSGVDEYRVQYRVGATGAWTDWLTRTTRLDYTFSSLDDLAPVFGPDAAVSLEEGTTYYFRVQAVDRAGNVETVHAVHDAATKFGDGGKTVYLPIVLRQ